MKKIINLSLFIIFTSLNIMAQTNVNGAYFSDTTWDMSGSPYYLIGDVQIATGVTLTIDPNVEIYYNGDYELLVKGVIIANGNQTAPIIFNGYNDDNTSMISL